MLYNAFNFSPNVKVLSKNDNGKNKLSQVKTGSTPVIAE